MGTEIKAEGAVLLKAGQDLSATAAQIASAQGAVTLSAGRDVELLAGEANKVVEEMTQKTKKSLFKKKTVTTYNKTDTTTAIGTTLSGDRVNIVAGRDITLAAAQAVSDNGTKLIADRDITIDGVTNSVDTEQFKKTVKSGLFSGGGIGVTIGKQELSQATKTSQETHQGSVVASVAGDVDIYAGGKYRQVGSEVQAPQGDVTIKGKSIDIVEARNQSAQDTETKFRQSGLSLSLSAPGVDAAMGAIKAGEHVTQTQDDRMKALAAATAISKAKQAVEEIQKFNDLAKAQQEQSIRISLSVGSQQSKSSQHNEANQAAGSSVLADGKLSLIATGGGQDSNVTVRGSTLAGQDVFIKADNKIDLLAAQNTSEQHSKDSSSSASIGIGISLGQENRLGFTASASVSKGNADGKDTNYSATQVTGGSSVTLQSGGDTTLGGRGGDGAEGGGRHRRQPQDREPAGHGQVRLQEPEHGRQRDRRVRGGRQRQLQPVQGQRGLCGGGRAGRHPRRRRRLPGEREGQHRPQGRCDHEQPGGDRRGQEQLQHRHADEQ